MQAKPEQLIAKMAANTASIVPSVTIVLAGQPYEVRPLPVIPASAWRKKLEQPLGTFAQLISQVGELQDMSPGAIAGVLYQAKDTLLGSLDLVTELLLEYAPAIREDWERVGNLVYDVDIVDAFLQVLPLAYPLDQLGARLKPLLGRLNRTTSTN